MKYLKRYKLFESDELESEIEINVKNFILELEDKDYQISIKGGMMIYSGDPSVDITISKGGKICTDIIPDIKNIIDPLISYMSEEGYENIKFVIDTNILSSYIINLSSFQPHLYKNITKVTICFFLMRYLKRKWIM